MISNRLYQSLSKTPARRGVANFFCHRQHLHVSVQRNLLGENLLEPSITVRRKCRPIFDNSFSSFVRNYSSDVPESSGVVRILRGFRQNEEDGLGSFSFFAVFQHFYYLSKVLGHNFIAFFTYVTGFEQAFVAFLRLLKEANINDLDREWLLPDAQQDTKDILSSVPSDILTEAMSPPSVLPVFVGYAIQRLDSSSFVDAAVVYPCVMKEQSSFFFWHVVYTRRIGPGIRDGWAMKAVALCNRETM